MKRKKRSFYLDSEQKWLIAIIIIISLSVAIGVVCYKNTQETPNVTHGVTNKRNNDKLFVGYKIYNMADLKDVKYDAEKRYKFTYADTKKKSIKLKYYNDTYVADLSIQNNNLIIEEQVMRQNELHFTGNRYTFRATSGIKSFIVGSTCDDLVYSVLILDNAGNVYQYNATNNNALVSNITYNIKKVNTISGAKNIGIYTFNNNPPVKCAGYEAIYVDQNDNVRYLGTDNLFYHNNPYRYIGSASKKQYVNVWSGGTMKFAVGNENELRNNTSLIKYRGSFYKLNKDSEDLYIIGTDSYLYAIKNLSEKSDYVLKPVKEVKIKRLGYQKQKDENDVAIDQMMLIFEFTDETILKIEDVNAFEVLE